MILLTFRKRPRNKLVGVKILLDVNPYYHPCVHEVNLAREVVSHSFNFLQNKTLFGTLILSTSNVPPKTRYLYARRSLNADHIKQVGTQINCVKKTTYLFTKLSFSYNCV